MTSIYATPSDTTGLEQSATKAVSSGLEHWSDAQFKNNDSEKMRLIVIISLDL